MAAAAEAGVPEAEGLVVGGAGEEVVRGAGRGDGVHDGFVPCETLGELVGLDVDGEDGVVGRAGEEVAGVETPLNVENGVVVEFEG